MKPWRVAVLGLGPMGTAIARAFCDAGFDVKVWNRTRSRATALLDSCDVAETVRAACESRDIIVICVRNYEATLDILRGEATLAARGKLLVQLTSGTPHEARELDAWARANGLRYLEGAIKENPSGIGYDGTKSRGRGLVYYSGPRAVYDGAIPTLSALGRQPLFVGEAIGAANAADVAFRSVEYAAVAGFLHGAALCESEGIAIEWFLAKIPSFIPAVGLVATEQALPMIRSGTYAGGRANMDVRADALRHVVHSSRRNRVDSTLPTALLALFERTIALGHGASEIPSMFEVIRAPRRVSRGS